MLPTPRHRGCAPPCSPPAGVRSPSPGQRRPPARESSISMSAGGALFLAGTLDQVGGNPSSPLKHHLSTSHDRLTPNHRPVQVATFPVLRPLADFKLNGLGGVADQAMADGDEKCGQHLVQVDGWAARLGLAPPRPRMPAPPPPPAASTPLFAPPNSLVRCCQRLRCSSARPPRRRACPAHISHHLPS